MIKQDDGKDDVRNLAKSLRKKNKQNKNTAVESRVKVKKVQKAVDMARRTSRVVGNFINNFKVT